ncbi:hypothetical protein EIN_206300 [Entamoeba invadens IP1]|uniref:Thioredoxin domain-containing protein n=1 Tax=Entamoeba invadens IP1 TaxID=370355 RepID=A0A0A1UFH2_ENTIV|nr:hypothetical protein EIN_206300 [Entamoeba invadens IP1]ELP91643.1 hypothetical protein EIN_206300 [Entamoeba invadens IP1]|eukprot:XP_004258414.1 hypothetical protein EIN_206300 [Entamoeba invadens IP1]
MDQKMCLESQVVMVSTEEHLLSIMNKSSKVVLDFFAFWSNPINTVERIQNIANTHTDIQFILINAEESFDLLQHYVVSDLPTLIFFVNGVEEARVCEPPDEAINKLLSH